MKDTIIVIRGNNGDMGIIMESNIKSMNYCNTHSNYGQEIGCCDAGCYSFDNDNSDFLKDLIKFIKEKYDIEIDEFESYYSSPEEFIKEFEGFNDFQDIKKSIENWIEENEHHVLCNAVDYWDGSNWKSIITYNEYCDEFGYDVLDEMNEEVQTIKKELPDSTPYIEGTCLDVKTENYTFSFSRYPSPYFCEILNERW